ncbi:MAG: SagB/ThcOx family dehydrogenase [Kiritimatiellae bacterium]|nr:SagB/ThcOx family dehydrogenase [Kiritimatiellia bacterium]
MKNNLMLSMLSLVALTTLAQDITLPEPVKQGGMPLMEALAERKSSRAFSPKELPNALLSSLLWAADGINRGDGRRTAPTGLNVQDIDLFVMLPGGVYRYDAKANTLVSVNPGDHRTAAGKQPFTHTAPLNLFFVQNLDKAMKADETNTARHGGIHAGAIMQNVYLFCAKEKLSCVVRDSLDREALTSVLKLTSNQRIIIGQTVGYPKE